MLPPSFSLLKGAQCIFNPTPAALENLLIFLFPMPSNNTVPIRLRSCWHEAESKAVKGPNGFHTALMLRWRKLVCASRGNTCSTDPKHIRCVGYVHWTFSLFQQFSILSFASLTTYRLKEHRAIRQMRPPNYWRWDKKLQHWLIHFFSLCCCHMLVMTETAETDD